MPVQNIQHTGGKRWVVAGTMFAFGLAAGYLATLQSASELQRRYTATLSTVVTDRHGNLIEVVPNNKGYFALPVTTVPKQFRELLLRQEDRFFYLHPGVNPVGLMRQFWRLVWSGQPYGGSTLTQQLAKILLANENDRTFSNKLNEAWFALSLELHTTKDEVLRMYANSTYFGNRSQGITEAGHYYFNTDPAALTTDQILALLATLGSPAQRYPGTKANAAQVSRLRSLFQSETAPGPARNLTGEIVPLDFVRRGPTAFETASWPLDLCAPNCHLTVDRDLTEKIRALLERNLRLPSFASVQNGAVVVLRIPRNLPTNEILAIVGSPNPQNTARGYQLNMAVKPRPIGSTAKPFIYAQAFAADLRPYTLVEDREYKYDIGTGFALYPKNYDGQYRGTVTLHESLTNSLNVPTVKVLEYIGLPNFSRFLLSDLGFVPLQPLESYGLGIALGALEMDLLTLVNYFTIFPAAGELRPLAFVLGNSRRALTPPMSLSVDAPRKVAPSETIQLVNVLLSDRIAAADQFGLASNLNLPFKNYAVKTGTSRDYHDSWAVGYTPDFAVGVWLGNSDNTPMHRLSGQVGAGKVWHEVMQLMATTPYYDTRPFARDRVREFTRGASIEYGLPADRYDEYRTALEDAALIMNPHGGDELLWSAVGKIPLTARRVVEWSINGAKWQTGQSVSWGPRAPGIYRITADDLAGQRETIVVTVQPPEE